MELVKTDSNINTYRTKISIENDFHNTESSTSVGSTLWEEFVTITKYTRTQPSILTLDSSLTINMTYPVIRIRY